MEQFKSKATISLVLGIVAVAAAWFGYFAIAGIVCGIIGLVIGIQIRKASKAQGFELNGAAKAGFILSIIGLALSVGMFIACVACVGLFAAAGGTIPASF